MKFLSMILLISAGIHIGQEKTDAAPTCGVEKFQKEINKRMRYPAQARRMMVEGQVLVRFIVNEDGSLSDAEVFRGIGACCDEEALRVVAAAAKECVWQAATENGVAIKQKATAVVKFKLG